MKVKLTKEEKQIERDLLAGRFKLLSPAEHARHRRYAAAQVKRRGDKKDARINIRLTSDVLELFKRRAARDGLPYQSLMASLIFRYATGTLVDVSDVAAIRRALRAG
jgi:predicted DNA binding CopG/RHH family protein